MINIENTDCLPAMREMEDNAFCLAIVDPEYGIGAGKKQQSLGLRKKWSGYHKKKYKSK